MSIGTRLNLGARGQSRTADLYLRRVALFPTELHAHVLSVLVPELPEYLFRSFHASHAGARRSFPARAALTRLLVARGAPDHERRILGQVFHKCSSYKLVRLARLELTTSSFGGK